MLKDYGAGVARRYGYRRGPEWRAARRAYLKRQPSCAACKVQYRGFFAPLRRLFTGTVVHHIVPIHVCFALGRPDLETDTRNLLTLCAGHHLLIGHVLNYEEFNIYAKACVLRCWGKPTSEIWDNPEFKRFAEERYRPFSMWSDDEREAFRRKLWEKFPPK